MNVIDPFFGGPSAQLCIYGLYPKPDKTTFFPELSAYRGEGALVIQG